MGRGAYDTTDTSNAASAAGGAAVDSHHEERKQAAFEAQVKAAVAHEQKLIRFKKSRGIMAAKRAMQYQTKGGTSEGGGS